MWIRTKAFAYFEDWDVVSDTLFESVQLLLACDTCVIVVLIRVDGCPDATRSQRVYKPVENGRTHFRRRFQNRVAM
jgi:hypothetical protein